MPFSCFGSNILPKINDLEGSIILHNLSKNNCIPFCFRLELGLRGHVREVAGGAGDARLESKDEADEDVLQTPPTEDDEVLLRDKPQSGRQGPEAALPEDRPTEKSPAGKPHPDWAISGTIKQVAAD